MRDREFLSRLGWFSKAHRVKAKPLPAQLRPSLAPPRASPAPPSSYSSEPGLLHYFPQRPPHQVAPLPQPPAEITQSFKATASASFSIRAPTTPPRAESERLPSSHVSVAWPTHIRVRAGCLCTIPHQPGAQHTAGLGGCYSVDCPLAH